MAKTRVVVVDDSALVRGLHKLNGLRVLTRLTTSASAPEIRAQTEVLRKMLLAMVEDIRVVQIGESFPLGPYEVRLDDVREAQLPKLDDVKPQIMQQLQQQMKMQKLK